MGLANVLVPQDQVRDAAFKLANEIAENSPLGLMSTRATMRAGLADRVKVQPSMNSREQTWLRATEDFKGRRQVHRRTPRRKLQRTVTNRVEPPRSARPAVSS